MPQHTVRAFDRELAKLQETIVDMGYLAAAELSYALIVLAGEGGASRLEEALNADEEVNAKQKDVEHQVIQLIARRQPLAVDLRVAVACLKNASEIERIGDQAKDVAAHAVTLAGLEKTGLEPLAIRLGKRVHRMLEEVLDAYSALDVPRAEELWVEDQAIDVEYSDLVCKLLQVNRSDASKASPCSHLVFIARSIERIGDHVTNIAEEICYIVRGHGPEGKRPTADRTALLSA
jgi:phosphate transport system protein